MAAKLTIPALPTSLVTPNKPNTLTNLPKLEAVPKLPRLVYPSVYRFKSYSNVEDGAFNSNDIMNDPYALNSFADIFSREIKERNLRSWAKDFHKVPVLGDLATSLYAAAYTVVNPIKQFASGEPDKAVFNTLANVSETLDIFTNPVRSLIVPHVNKNKSDPMYHISAGDRLGAGLGINQYGHYNYNYDTGFWLADFALEMISDPVSIVGFIVTVGRWGIAKAGAVAVKKGVEKTIKAAGSEISSQVVKTISKEVIQSALKANNLTETTLKYLGKYGDDTLNTLADSLNLALKSNKSIINDTTKGIMNDITEYIGKNSTDLFLKNKNLTTELVDTLADYNKLTKNKYSVLDYLKDIGYKVGTEGSQDLTQPKFWKGVLPASILTVQRNKALKKGNEEVAEQILKNIDTLLTSPANRKKYKKIIEESESAIEALNKIDFTDYLQAANDYLQVGRTYGVHRALDAILAANDNLDKIILKAALVGTNPIGTAIYGYFKFNPRVGAKVGTWFMQRLTDISDYIQGKTIVSALFDYDEYLDTIIKTAEQFDIFSDTQVSKLDFSQPIADSIYNNTLTWLNGYADASKYLPDPETKKPKKVNLWLTTPERRKANIYAAYKHHFPAGTKPEAVEEAFWKQLDNMGHLAHKGTLLGDLNVSDYLKTAQITNQEDSIRQLYQMFNTNTKVDKALNSKKTFLRMMSGNSIKAEKGQIEQAAKAVNEFFVDFTDIKKAREILTKDLDSIGLKYTKQDIKNTMDTLNSLSGVLNKLDESYKVLDSLKNVKANEVAIQKQMLVIADGAKAAKHQASQLRTNIRNLKNKPDFSKTEFYKVYQRIAQIDSPYFGQAQQILKDSEVLFELKAKNRAKTLQVLKDPEFRAFIESFHEGGSGANALKAMEQKAKSGLKLAEENGTELDKKAAEGFKNQLTLVDVIRKKLIALDNYVQHSALVKQSGMPEVMQEIYFDVLEELPIQKANVLIQNLKNTVQDVVHKMNDKLAGRFSTHRYNNDYFARKLLDDKDFKEAAQAYLQSNQTALDEAVFTETLFNALVLPELSKEQVVNIANKEVISNVNRSWNYHKNRELVYLDFELTGKDTYLDQLYDIGFYSPATNLKWNYSHKNFDMNGIATEYRNQILSRSTPLSETGTELAGLLTLMYKLQETAQTIKQQTGKAMTVVVNNRQNKNLQVILTRLQQHAELANLRGDQELTISLNRYIDWFRANILSSNLSSIDLLKKFDDVPNVGEYYATVDRCLMSYIRQQAYADSVLNITLDDSFITELKSIEGITYKNYENVLNKTHKLISEIDSNASLWANRVKLNPLEGRLVVDADVYSKNAQSIFTNAESYNTVQIKNKAELLSYKNDVWTYQGKELPRNIKTSDEAIEFLRKKNIVYAPTWVALNPEQQLSTYPVLINGNVSLQNLPGVVPVKFTKYIDTNLIQDYFKVKAATYSEQNLLTILSQQMGQVLSQVTDFRKLDSFAKEINRAYNSIAAYTKMQQGFSPYRLLRDDLDIYHKFAVLTVMVHDNSPGIPTNKLKALLKELAVPKRVITNEDMLAQGFKKQKFKEFPKFSRKNIDFLDHPNRPVYPVRLPNETNEEFAGRVIAFNRVNAIYKNTQEYKDIVAFNRALNDEAYKHHREVVIPGIYAENAKILQDNQTYDALKKEWQAQVDAEVKELNETVYKGENDLREDFRKAIYTPEFYVYKDSEYSRIFNSYNASKSLAYENPYYSKNDFLENIYKSEKAAGTYQARALKDVIAENSNDVKNLTNNLKYSLDKDQLYTPVMQRHAIIGKSHVELNDAYIKLLNKLQTDAEYNAFMACDAQIVNNLDDLMMKQVLQMSTQQLTSLVYHQGKGVIALPVGYYLKDKSFHSFDLQDSVKDFLAKVESLKTDKNLAVYKHNDMLYIYAKDYKLHVKQKDIPYIPLKALDYNLAFKAAYGYPTTPMVSSAYIEALNEIKLRYPEESVEYIKEVQKLNKEFNTNYGINSKQTAFLFTHYDDIEELRQAHLKHHKRLLDLAVDYDDKYNYLMGGYGRPLSYSNFLEIHQNLPKQVRLSLYNNLDDAEVKKLFETSTQNSFNFITFGRAAYRKELEFFAKSNYQTIMTETYRELNRNLSALAQYSNFFFEDSSLRLSNMMDVFKQAGQDEAQLKNELFQALYKQEEFVVTALKVDKKGMPRAMALKIKSMQDLDDALKLNAIVLPNQTYASFIETVHAKAWDNPVLNFFSKINYYLKLSMQFSIGFIIRNFIDSTLKNILVAKDAATLGESYIDAMRYYQQYTQVIQDLFKLDGENPFRPDNLEVYFSDSTRVMDADTFSLIHNFIENGPSAGSIKQVSEYYLEASLKKTGKKRDIVQVAYEAIMEPTKQIEQITRLALYVDLIKNKMPNTAAFKVITDTHFDYGSKSNVERLLELLIPYYSFQKKNFSFWLNAVIDNPRLSYAILQGASSQWHFEGINEQNLHYYQGRLNQVLSGNVILNDSGLTLKLSPSFMDPLNLMLSPLESFSGRVTPVVDFLTDVFEGDTDTDAFKAELMRISGSALAALPGVGLAGAVLSTTGQVSALYSRAAYQADKSYSTLPLIAPSLFGYTYTGRAKYYNQRTYMDKTYRVPRIRNTNIYNKLYTDTGKNRWQLRFQPVDNFTMYWRIRESTNLYR